MTVLHIKMIVRLVVVSFLAATLVKAEVTLGENGYSNLLVSLPPNLSIEDGEIVLGTLQELMENTSLVLNSTLGILIGDVTFLLPDAWISGLNLESQVTPASRQDSDIVVESVQDDPFGKNPLAVQFGGCGVRGSHITLSPEFVTGPEDYPKGKLLAREWLKYRYGVFDENGFPGDPLYPSHYTIPGIDDQVQVTECTDPQVEYVFKDSNGNNCSLLQDPVDTCNIHPGEMSAEEVTSSLMYFHQELPNLEHVCGNEHPHNNLGPSKQNILCGEKSIWEVLQDSPDFKNPPTAVPEYPGVAFHFARERKPKVAVLFETTIHLANKKDELIFALQRLVYDLPAGSQLSLYSFNDNKFTGELRPMSELTDRNIVQNWDFDGSGTDVCPLCALEKAVDGFPENDKHGSVILIVGSNSTLQDNSVLVGKLKTSKLCVTLIALRDTEASMDGYSDFLDQLDCQTLVEIPNSEEKMATFNTMYQFMISSVPSTYTESPKEVVASGVMSSKNGIQIQPNPRASKFTIWLGRPIFEDNIACRTDGSDIPISKADPLSNLAYTFDPTDKEVTCNLQRELAPEVFTQVQMTTEAGKSLSGRVWIHDPTPEGSNEQLPVTIYVKINYGGYPVSDATVKATVTNSEGQTGDFFELYDNGKGDPDVTKNDGIYSRYFFQFNKEGTYYVSVEVTDNGGTATALKNGEDRCCGSQINTHKQEHVPAFTQTFTTKFHAVSARPEDGYPPSKIIDLRVGEYKPPTLLELKWTAPGGEVDTGKASAYEFKFFCDSEACPEDGSLPSWIMTNDSNPEPKDAGQGETVQFLLSDQAPVNATVKIAVVAIRHNRTSGLSNRVQLRMRGEAQIPDPSPTTTIQKDDPAVSVGTIIGASVVGVLVLFCIVVLVWFLVSRTKRRRDLKSGTEVDATERSGSFRASNFRDYPVRKADSFPVMLYTHDQIKDVKIKTKVKEPPLFRAAAKPWLSLGELPSGQQDHGGSDGSGSTIPVKRWDGRHEGTEW